jgi:hypothetical protein
VLAAVGQAVPIAFGPICGSPPSELGFSAPDESDVWIIGAIPFASASPWALALLCSRDTAVALARAVTGSDIAPESAAMGEAMGELVNLLAGHVAGLLVAMGQPAQMTLPMVARGQKVRLYPPGVARLLLLGYQCPQGRFWVRLAFVSPPDKAGRAEG